MLDLFPGTGGLRGLFRAFVAIATPPTPPARAVSFIPYQIRNSWRRGVALCEGDQGIGEADYGI